MKIHPFHVTGTHCESCKFLIEDTLNKQSFVENVRVNLKRKIVELDTDSDKSLQELAQILSEKIKSHGYSLSEERPPREIESDSVIWKALPLGLVILISFFLLQKSGVLNFGFGGKPTPTTAFFVGLIASVSSCLAIVGGLVLSLSAKLSQANENATKTFLLFHLGRLGSFTILGGLLGVAGKLIGINYTVTTILGLFASLVMILLGLNLLGVFVKSKFTLPSGIFHAFQRIEKGALTPLVVGFGTFFLPCGFTQSMQVVALSSGSFVAGLLIMGSFALGTLPMLVILSFGTSSFAQSKYAPLFFKSSGVVVIGLGIFAFASGLAALGIISPIFNI